MSDEQRKLEDVVTHRELADFLGVSERSLSYFRIPHVDMGARRLYFKQSVVEWLARREGKGRIAPDRQVP